MSVFSAQDLRDKFLKYFESKDHKIIASASLIPDNDPTVLFTTAGMHPLVPYLMGEKHPQGTRLASVQKCIRTGDIDEVGDTTHHTFFEMLGNWSLGDYNKTSAIEYSWEFLTEILKLDKEKLAVTVFGGNDAIKEYDAEAENHWLAVGVKPERIARLSANWWGPAGTTGPCGPDTEMFYWVGAGSAPVVFDPEDNNWVEIWNDVLMEYNKTPDNKFEALQQKNIDTGMGLERTLAVLNGVDDNYKTELFWPIIQELEKLSGKKYEDDQRSFRIVADHIRSAVFILGDNNGVAPSNKDQGYVLRKIIRRAIRFSKEINIKDNFIKQLATIIIKKYSTCYPELVRNENFIINEMEKEESKVSDNMKNIENIKNKANIIFTEAGLKNSLTSYKFKEKIWQPWSLCKSSSGLITRQIKQGEDGGDITRFKNLCDYYYFETKDEEFNYAKQTAEKIILNLKENSFNLTKVNLDILIKEAINIHKKSINLMSDLLFDLWQSIGADEFFIVSLLEDFLEDKIITIEDRNNIYKDFEAKKIKHQDLSRTASAGMFKGGLADDKQNTKRHHTAAHLMLQALRMVLGEHVEQRGSNINEDRMRFDFTHPEKMTPEQIKKVEDIVNEQINKKMPVSYQEMSVAEAKEYGAIGIFEHKYGDKVKVYTMGDFSKEICGGPHVDNTAELGSFKIIKEESSSAGVRRIKAQVHPVK